MPMAESYKIAFQKLMERLSEFKTTYKDFVLNNPETVDQIEKSVRTGSFLLEALTTDYEASIFLTEFVSCVHNLFAFANSHLFLNSRKSFSERQNLLLVDKIKQVLSVVEFSQAFVEIAARKIGGSGARWAIILLICLVKAVLRCLLIFVFQTGMQSPSSVSMIRTSAFISSKENENPPSSDQELPNVYVGKRTGHKIKTLKSSSSASTSSPSHASGLKNSVFFGLPPTPFTATEKFGECLHAIRPLLHVLTTGACGTTSYIPWLSSLVIDSSSHVLLHRAPTSSSRTQPQYNENEKAELQRRYVSMLLYLMRSPIYDKHTSVKLMSALTFLAEKLPLGRFVFEPLKKYIPEWQRVYFYTWAD